MTGPEHYREAERLLELASDKEIYEHERLALLAAAEVHGALAVAAATALGSHETGMCHADYGLWHDTVSSCPPWAEEQGAISA